MLHPPASPHWSVISLQALSAALLLRLAVCTRILLHKPLKRAGLDFTMYAAADASSATLIEFFSHLWIRSAVVTSVKTVREVSWTWLWVFFKQKNTQNKKSERNRPVTSKCVKQFYQQQNSRNLRYFALHTLKYTGLVSCLIYCIPYVLAKSKEKK